MAYAALAAAALGVGGSVAGGLLGSSGETTGGSQGGMVAGRDPLLNAAAREALAQLGIFDPNFILQSSPLNQALAAYGSLAIGHKRRKLDSTFLVSAFEKYKAALERGETVDLSVEAFRASKAAKTPYAFSEDEIKAVNNIAAQLGVTGKDLLRREFDFRSTVEPNQAKLRAQAEQGATSRQEIMDRLNALARSAPDVSQAKLDELQASEKQRLIDEINRTSGLQQSDILKAANAGNFNPGRALGDLNDAKLRAIRDTDLDSLSRAQGLLQANVGLAGSNLALLQNYLNPSAENLKGLAAISTAGSTAAQIGASQANVSNLGPGIAAAGANAANALLYANAGRSAPAGLQFQNNPPASGNLFASGGGYY